MPDHLLVDSQGTWAGSGAACLVGDAIALAHAGHRVRLLGIEDGVTLALPGASPELQTLLDDGGEVWVDDFSLARRGLRASDLLARTQVVAMDRIARELVEPGVRVVWH